ncbi:MAG: DUF6011 domain-containing protein [Gorillibacterium sp.]|nr:DUF6011 domain-containing protein [Gorillibacterium sp.]
MKPEEYEHCQACHRKLKNPKWKRLGYGPKCSKRLESKGIEKVQQLEMKF